MMQFRTRPAAHLEISAVADDPPQPIELRAIEAEFYDALEDGADDDAALSRHEAVEAGGPAAPLEPEANRRSSEPRRESQRDDLSPARRLAAPMFIATCLVLGLLTHGADANRLLSLWPQAETSPPRAEAAPCVLESVAPDLALSATARLAATPSRCSRRKPRNPSTSPWPMRVRLARRRSHRPTPSEPLATRPIDADPGEALFVPIAIDVICAIPVVFDLARPEPASRARQPCHRSALTDLYPFEPWSMRPSDAGPVGRAQMVIQALASSARSTALPLTEAQAPAAPLAKTGVKSKPVSRPSNPAKVRPVTASNPAPPRHPNTDLEPGRLPLLGGVPDRRFR